MIHVDAVESLEREGATRTDLDEDRPIEQSDNSLVRLINNMIIEAHKEEAQKRNQMRQFLMWIIIAIVIGYAILSGPLLLGIVAAGIIWFIFRYTARGTDAMVPSRSVSFRLAEATSATRPSRKSGRCSAISTASTAGRATTRGRRRSRIRPT